MRTTFPNTSIMLSLDKNLAVTVGGWVGDRGRDRKFIHSQWIDLNSSRRA